MIYAYAQSDTPLATLRNESFQLAVRGAVVARIDTNLIHKTRSDRCYLGDKMNISYGSSLVAIKAQLRNDILQILTLLTTLRGKTDNARSSIGDALNLCHAKLRIGCRSIGHRLHSNGMLRTDSHITNAYLVCPATCIFCKIHIFRIMLLTFTCHYIQN